MTTPAGSPGLRVGSPLIAHAIANLRPKTWPPNLDQPVVVGANGEVISVVGDTYWKVGLWIGRSMVVSFGDGSTKGRRISSENAYLLRMVSAFWLWGPSAVRSPRSLIFKNQCLKPIFSTCSEAGVLASDLYRYPQLIEKVASRIPKGATQAALLCLHDVWSARHQLGFTILDEAGLKKIAGLLVTRVSTQTAYIPPRIWAYQVRRLRECIDDFLAHREQVEACYRFCLDAYAINAGGSPTARLTRLLNGQMPFHPANLKTQNPGTRVFYGAFRLTAERFGIWELLKRWVNTSDQSGIKSLSSYLSLISAVGLGYALNFSLMRVDEGSLLRADCFSTERDSVGEDIHLITGRTTKTIEDDLAAWIVAPSVQFAVDAMKYVAALRLEAAIRSEKWTLDDEEYSNPYLQSWAFEPWASPVKRASRKKPIAYSALIKSWPKLFSQEELRITENDLALANQMTFGLDPNQFVVGKVWPLAWHQLRRTGAVNMLASGMVSDASLQYQLKHASRGMTRYYGQNYHRLNAQLDDEARALYLREMYEALAREFCDLQSDNFVSPHGERRKAQILEPISEKDHAGLVADGRAGRVAYRQTFIGGCAKPGDACPLGGISNIVGCMGSDNDTACEFVLVDRRKRPMIVKLRGVLAMQLETSEPESPSRKSLLSQVHSAERALYVIDRV